MAGELIIKNGLIISGSITSTTGFTGSFSGSINNAVSSSYALTASFALNAGTTVNTSSFVTTSSFNAFTSSYNTGSFSGSFSGAFLGTSSWSISSSQSISSSWAISSSRAITSSYAIQASSASWAPGGVAFPYTGSAEITGSLNVVGTLRTTGSVIVQNGSIGIVSTGTTNASEAFKVQNSTPDNLLTIKDDGEISINTTQYNLNGILENNGGIIQEIQGWTGNININTTPPISITVQNGIITNVI